MKVVFLFIGLLFCFAYRSQSKSTECFECLTVIKYRVTASETKDPYPSWQMPLDYGDTVLVSGLDKVGGWEYWRIHKNGRTLYVNAESTDRLGMNQHQIEFLKKGNKKENERRMDFSVAQSILVYQRAQKRAIEKRVADSTANVIEQQELLKQKRIAFIQDSVRREEERIADAKKAVADSIAEAEKEAKTQQAIDALRKEYSVVGIAVTDWSWGYESDYSSMSYAKVKVWNPTKRRIKYVHFSFTAENAVGDRLTSFGKSIVTVKGIGPIEPDEFASWEFDTVFWSKVIETMSISTIKVEYFDGTFKTISSGSRAIL